jgi:Protein of unknown function (DUF3634)
MPIVVSPFQTLAYLVLAGFGGVLIWAVWRGRADFVIRICDGQPQTAQGKVAGAFLRDLEEICHRQGIMQGRIRGVRSGRDVSLQFSRTIPPTCRQQIRNVWNFSR